MPKSTRSLLQSQNLHEATRSTSYEGNSFHETIGMGYQIFECFFFHQCFSPNDCRATLDDCNPPTTAGQPPTTAGQPPTTAGQPWTTAGEPWTVLTEQLLWCRGSFLQRVHRQQASVCVMFWGQRDHCRRISRCIRSSRSHRNDNYWLNQFSERQPIYRGAWWKHWLWSTLSLCKGGQGSIWPRSN